MSTQASSAPHGERRRKRVGWGFEGEAYPPSAQLLQWLHQRLGEAKASRSGDLSALTFASRLLPDLGPNLSQDRLDRLAHARGQGLPDLLRLRSATIRAVPDGVLRPRDREEVEEALGRCRQAQVQVIPWGGGTSVTGGVSCLPSDRLQVVLSLEHLNRLLELDQVSGLATFEAGARGPQLESALGRHGWTLGHFPQSWELSTLGGWVATRASGQESLRYGSIQDLVAGLELVAPAGRLDLPALPASAAGPDLRQLVLGSEGRLGIITRATVRVRRRPPQMEARAFLLPSWEHGLEGARALVQGGLPLSLLRLSDEPETEVALAVGLSGHRRLAPLVKGWLRLRGIAGGGCLMLLAAAGTYAEVERTQAQAAEELARHGAVSLGGSPGRKWLAERFRHPYLRDALLDRGIATDTLETAAPWSRLPALTRAVRHALESALEAEGERTAALCHVSHPYRDGASLYFTFFFRSPADPEAAIHRWATLKRAATEALVTSGGTLSHHHGVGSWHAPWLEHEVGATGVELLRRSAALLDPEGTLNPHVLLDPTDRLEA